MEAFDTEWSLSCDVLHRAPKCSCLTGNGTCDQAIPMIKVYVLTILATGLGATAAHGSSLHDTDLATSWNWKKAAAYLDERVGWWMAWPATARGQGTFCVSCHTAMPYALARPALRGLLGETILSLNERRLLDNVTKRVRLWKNVEPFYNDRADGPNTTARARGTEAVLNALILASYDARNGKLTDDARSAF
jgi:hypothetical protein